MDLPKLLRLLRTRRVLLLGLLAAALVAATLAHIVARQNAQFVAEAVVLPSPRAMNPAGLLPGGKDASQAPTYDRFSRLALFTTRLENEQDDALDLAQQPPRAQKRAVARALSGQIATAQGKTMALDPNASDAQLNSVLAAFRIPTDPATWTPRTVSPALRQQIRDGFRAAPVVSDTVNQTPGAANPTPTPTDFLSIQVRAPGPDLARQVAILTAAAFINSYADTSHAEYDASLARAQTTQKGTAAALTRARDALAAYQKKSRFVDIKQQGEAAVADLETLKQQQSRARIDAVSATGAAQQLEASAQAATPQTRVSLDPAARPEAQALTVQIGADEAALQTLSKTLTPDNPRFQQAQNALDAKREQLVNLLKQPYIVAQPNPQFVQLTTQAAQAQAEAARAQGALRQINAQIAALEKQNLSTLPDAQRILSALQNDADTAAAAKKAAAAAYQELLTASRQQDNGFVALSRAPADAVPDSAGPSLPALLVYAAVLALALGVGLTLALDALDRRIQTPQDAARLLGMPVTAAIPALPLGTEARAASRIVLSDPLSPYAESYRLLRTDLLFAASERPFQSLMCATAKPGQGATTTLCNLAIALAQSGKRVILVDADLRRPKLHTFFGTPNDMGLTDLLRGECELEEALKHTETDNLLLLPSGPTPPNPSELLASQRMRTLHERLKPHTDFVLVDTPSAIAFSDSAILASFVDAVLVVVRAQEVPRGGERGVQEMLARARARVVGVVLNGVRPELVDSYYFHSAYYPQALDAGRTALPTPPVKTNGYEQTLMGVVLPPPSAKEPPKHKTINLRSLLGPDDEE